MTTNTAPVDVSHYTVRVTWSREDDEFVATCLELPSLSRLAGSQGEALTGLVNLVEEVVDDLAANGEPVPEPLADREYSGKFNLRVGPNLHRRLAMEAAQQGQSLNQYVVQKLSAS